MSSSFQFCPFQWQIPPFTRLLNTNCHISFPYTQNTLVNPLALLPKYVKNSAMLHHYQPCPSFHLDSHQKPYNSSPTLVRLEPNLHTENKASQSDCALSYSRTLQNTPEHSHNSDSKMQRQRSTFLSHFLSRSPFPWKLATLVSLL